MCMEVPVPIGSPEVWNTLRWPSLRNGFLYSWVLLRFGTPFGSHPQQWVPVLMGSPEVPNALRSGFLYSWVLLRFATPSGSHPQEWVPALMGSPEVPNNLGLTPSGVGSCTHGFS